ncbi:hypothetical protein D3C81_1822240 [compost metagenome]
MNFDKALVAVENHGLAGAKLGCDIESQVETIESRRHIGIAIGAELQIELN